MGKFQVISHPLIQHKLSILRREDTSTKDFRELVNEIAMLMGYEVSRDLPLEEVEIQTPITKTVQKQLSGKKLAIVSLALYQQLKLVILVCIVTRKLLSRLSTWLNYQKTLINVRFL